MKTEVEEPRWTKIRYYKEAVIPVGRACNGCAHLGMVRLTAGLSTYVCHIFQVHLREITDDELFAQATGEAPILKCGQCLESGLS
jgi:hypothetical protein